MYLSIAETHNFEKKCDLSIILQLVEYLELCLCVYFLIAPMGFELPVLCALLNTVLILKLRRLRGVLRREDKSSLSAPRLFSCKVLDHMIGPKTSSFIS